MLDFIWIKDFLFLKKLPKYGSPPSEVHPSHVRLQYFIESKISLRAFLPSLALAGINFFESVCLQGTLNLLLQSDNSLTNGSASTIDNGKLSFTMQLITESTNFKRSAESLAYGAFDNIKVLMGVDNTVPFTGVQSIELDRIGVSKDGL